MVKTVNISDLSQAQLKDELKKRNAPIHGTKAELAFRLRKVLEEAGQSTEVIEVEPEEAPVQNAPAIDPMMMLMKEMMAQQQQQFADMMAKQGNNLMARQEKLAAEQKVEQQQQLADMMARQEKQAAEQKVLAAEQKVEQQQQLADMMARQEKQAAEQKVEQRQQFADMMAKQESLREVIESRISSAEGKISNIERELRKVTEEHEEKLRNLSSEFRQEIAQLKSGNMSNPSITSAPARVKTPAFDGSTSYQIFKMQFEIATTGVDHQQKANALILALKGPAAEILQTLSATESDYSKIMEALEVAARYCEGGHLCSPPKECCAQGCCYLFAPPTIPRTTPPPSDHVLNLFFINHWYFWCLVLTIILALLCACSLWKRRRQFCHWEIPLPSSQSEGDSAGSCYAPPQYSRCSSFHHAPPPYTEVTSKPDLYPIVFTCNGDGVKNGASYLMVQYFRNYIVRPVGTLSATSTVDSLSSSFICAVNDSNTLVPPPYSRAASPDEQLNSASVGNIPRSSSHQLCFTDMSCFQFNTTSFGNSSHQSKNKNRNQTRMRLSESVNFQNLNNTNTNCIFNNNNHSVILSQSDQAFKYNIINSNSNSNSNINDNSNGNSDNRINSDQNINNSSLQILVKTNNNSTNKTNTNNDNPSTTNSSKISTKYNNSVDYTQKAIGTSYSSIGGISIPSLHQTTSENETKLNFIRHNIQLDSINHHNMPSASFNSEDSPINTEYVKKYESVRSLVNSNTGSAVSSLANIDSPSSPPRATSPTAEVKELLEQINNLQISNVNFDSIENIEATNSNQVHNYNNVYKNQNQNSYFSSRVDIVNNTSKTKRPSTLQTKKKFFSKTNKGLYTPITTDSSKSKPFLGASSKFCTGRGRRSWISRSAPTTPGSALPSCRIEDNSPLLNEHDEDIEQNV